MAETAKLGVIYRHEPNEDTQLDLAVVAKNSAECGPVSKQLFMCVSNISCVLRAHQSIVVVGDRGCARGQLYHYA